MTTCKECYPIHELMERIPKIIIELNCIKQDLHRLSNIKALTPEKKRFMDMLIRGYQQMYNEVFKFDTSVFDDIIKYSKNIITDVKQGKLINNDVLIQNNKNLEIAIQFFKVLYREYIKFLQYFMKHVKKDFCFIIKLKRPVECDIYTTSESVMLFGPQTLVRIQMPLEQINKITHQYDDLLKFMNTSAQYINYVQLKLDVARIQTIRTLDPKKVALNTIRTQAGGDALKKQVDDAILEFKCCRKDLQSLDSKNPFVNMLLVNVDNMYQRLTPVNQDLFKTIDVLFTEYNKILDAILEQPNYAYILDTPRHNKQCDLTRHKDNLYMFGVINLIDLSRTALASQNLINDKTIVNNIINYRRKIEIFYNKLIYERYEKLGTINKIVNEISEIQ